MASSDGSTSSYEPGSGLCLSYRPVSPIRDELWFRPSIACNGEPFASTKFETADEILLKAQATSETPNRLEPRRDSIGVHLRFQLNCFSDGEIRPCGA